MMFDHAAGHRHATREEATECFRCAGAQAVPPLDSLSEALHEAGIGCSSEVCEPTTEFHQGIRRTMHDTDARALLAALHPESSRTFYGTDFPAPEQGEPPCVYCNETRWVDDENWSPAYPETWKGERSPGDGLIPCGGCNEGGWNIPIARAASGAQAVPPLDVELILRLGHPAGCTVSGCHLKTAVDQYRAALHPEDGPQKHATWCWLPADHEGLCEGDQ